MPLWVPVTVDNLGVVFREDWIFNSTSGYSLRAEGIGRGHHLQTDHSARPFEIHLHLWVPSATFSNLTCTSRPLRRHPVCGASCRKPFQPRVPVPTHRFLLMQPQRWSGGKMNHWSAETELGGLVTDSCEFEPPSRSMENRWRIHALWPMILGDVRKPE